MLVGQSFLIAPHEVPPHFSDSHWEQRGEVQGSVRRRGTHRTGKRVKDISVPLGHSDNMATANGETNVSYIV